MTVVPGELDCVGADVFHADEFQVGANRFGVEHPLAGPLVAAGCTRAFAAEQEIGKRSTRASGQVTSRTCSAWRARMLVGGSDMWMAQ